MRRNIIFLFTVLFIFMSAVPAFGQSRGYRLNTRASDNQPQTVAPSFRGGTPPQGSGAIQSPYGSQPGMQMPGMMQGQMPTMGFGMGAGYSVHVLGAVLMPGTYRMPASGRLSTAIKMAQGFSANGSERRIELKRKGRKVQTVDLLRYTMQGNLADNPYLMENDVVYVPLRKNVVRVVGAVRRPETYELKNEKNLEQVLKLAGGFNAAIARDEPIRVVRFVDGVKKMEEIPVDSAELKTFSVRDGDVIVVPNVVTKDTEFDYNVAAIPGDQVFYPSYEDRVFVLGGVQASGAYPFSPYYTVNQYVSLAGGLNDRGKEKYRIIDISGQSRAAKENDRVNPGRTHPASATVLAITR